jgi:hypothetical protein
MENPWAALVGEVRAWIVRKEKDPLKGFFFTGGTWAGPGPARARVETRTLSDDCRPTPEMWAVRYEHVDGEVKARRWTTNISVTEIAAREWRVSVELLHRLRPDYVGPEPPRPRPSSPRLVIGLLDSTNWIGRIGSIRMKAQPSTMKVGMGPSFASLLADPKRIIPIVLVSCDRKSGVPKLDSVDLSRALAGTAAVYMCESPECDDELEHFVPMRFRSPNGTVRIYAPGVTFDQDWTAGRHRFFTGDDIDHQGDDEIIGHIVRALTRSDAWRGPQSSIASIDDIDARVRERRLTELRTVGTNTLVEKDEMLALYEADNLRLEGDNKALKDELEGARDRSARAESTVARLEYEVEQARASATESRAQALAEGSALQTVLDLTAWPEEPTEIATLAVKVSGDRLLFTAEAARSLEKSDFVTCDDAASVIWRCLRSMATELYDLLMQELPAQQIADEFKNRTKFDLTWTESKETKRDNKLMAKRRLVYEARELDITPHVKWGNAAPRLLRVHFYMDRDRKQIVIGHCGDHLDTYGTRRRR